MLRQSPSYFRFRTSTIRLEESVIDEVVGERLNIKTGAFEPATDDDIEAVFRPGGGMDYTELSEEEFVKRTEEVRSYYLRGEGPIFDIYRQIDRIYEELRQVRRKMTDEEYATIVALRRKTFGMWEDEFTRRAAGLPPSFEYSGPGGRKPGKLE